VLFLSLALLWPLVIRYSAVLTLLNWLVRATTVETHDDCVCVCVSALGCVSLAQRTAISRHRRTVGALSLLAITDTDRVAADARRAAVHPGARRRASLRPRDRPPPPAAAAAAAATEVTETPTDQRRLRAVRTRRHRCKQAAVVLQAASLAVAEI